MEGHISKKNAKQLKQKAEQAIQSDSFITDVVRSHRLFLVSIVDPGNCPPADQEMLQEFVNGF